MKYLEKLRRIPKHKLVYRILLLVVVIYSFVFAGVFFGLSVAVFNTVGSINIPNNYLLVSLVLEDPLLRASYKISNEGFSDVSNLIIDFDVDLCYSEEYTNNEKRENIFFKREKVKKINPWQKYEAFIEGSIENFNISNIEDFWSTVNLTKPIFYLLDIKITGK